jgi:hypothetical protein
LGPSPEAEISEKDILAMHKYILWFEVSVATALSQSHACDSIETR